MVHVVQSVLQWGKDPIVVVKREEGSIIQSDGKNESVVPEEKEIMQRCKRGQTFSCDSQHNNISMRKMILEVKFLKSMIYEILKIFRRITFHPEMILRHLF